MLIKIIWAAAAFALLAISATGVELLQPGTIAFEVSTADPWCVMAHGDDVTVEYVTTDKYHKVVLPKPGTYRIQDQAGQEVVVEVAKGNPQEVKLGTSKTKDIIFVHYAGKTEAFRLQEMFRWTYPGYADLNKYVWDRTVPHGNHSKHSSAVALECILPYCQLILSQPGTYTVDAQDWKISVPVKRGQPLEVPLFEKGPGDVIFVSHHDGKRAQTRMVRLVHTDRWPPR